jgi:hypothetical protein
MNILKTARGKFVALAGLASVVAALSVVLVWCVVLILDTPEPRIAAIDPSDIPTSVGNWRGVIESDNEWGLDLGLNMVSMRYTNQQTGTELSAIVVTGRPQHICEHTPDR